MAAPTVPKAAPDAPDAPCHLFRFPPELRVEVYRLALISETPIQITTNIFPEPPLLTTNKTIRFEARPIYYSENNFQVIIANFSCAPILALQPKLHTLRIHSPAQGARLDLFITGRPHWQNLKAWLKKVREGKIFLRLSMCGMHAGGHCTESATVHSLEKMVSTLRGSPWTCVEKVVDAGRGILVSVDGAWGDEAAV